MPEKLSESDRKWLDEQEIVIPTAPKKVFVRRWVYWQIDKNGDPLPSFCDGGQHLYVHCHLVAIPVPEDVLACCERTRNPPECLIMDKFSKPVGGCPKEEL